MLWNIFASCGENIRNWWKKSHIQSQFQSWQLQRMGLKYPGNCCTCRFKHVRSAAKTNGGWQLNELCCQENRQLQPRGGFRRSFKFLWCQNFLCWACVNLAKITMITSFKQNSRGVLCCDYFLDTSQILVFRGILAFTYLHKVDCFS